MKSYTTQDVLLGEEFLWQFSHQAIKIICKKIKAKIKLQATDKQVQ